LQEAGIVFEGVDDALRIPGVDVRLFGKPESFIRRRMGVVVAQAESVSEARDRAQRAVAKIHPVSGGG
jgi:phosphoribosylglycinamide formyltransferase 2